MSFSTNDVVEIETLQYRAFARIRNVIGDRIHVALERGGYLPWIDDPVLVRLAGDTSSPGIDARILHAGGVTAMLELFEVAPAAPSSGRLPNDQDTMTDEV